MEAVSKTNPLPPSGLTNTSVPLGIEASVSEVPQPVNISVQPTTVFKQRHGMYLGNFQLPKSAPIGKLLYEWDYRKPFTDSYKRTLDSETNQYSLFTPWDLVMPILSKEVKMEYLLQFIPVKISDSRARIDVIYKFEADQPADVYSTKLLANYNSRPCLDDSDEQLLFSIPTYWISNNVTTDMVLTTAKNSTGGIEDLNMPSAFIPETQMKVYVASRYHPNNMQMDEFNVHVIIYPIPTSMLGLAGKRTHTVSRPGVDSRTSLLTPYFLN